MTRTNPATETSATAPTRYVETKGVTFAYRDFGSRAGTPVVFLHHFTATIDEWDPAGLVFVVFEVKSSCEEVYFLKISSKISV